MRKTLLTLGLLWFAQVLQAGTGVEKILFQRYTIDDGLSQSSIYSIAEDSLGFLWFGTQDGLNRFDGYTFKIFRSDPHDSTTISDNYCWTVIASRRGGLWIGTYDGGFCYYDPITESFTRYRAGRGAARIMRSNNVPALLEEPSGVLWVGTWGGGLYRFDPRTGEWHAFIADAQNPHALISNRISSFALEQGRYLWIGTWAGVCRLDLQNWRKGIFEHYRYPDTGAQPELENQVWKLFVSRTGTIFASSWGGGVNLIDRQNRRMIDWEERLPLARQVRARFISEMFEDEEDRLWILTYDAGLYIWDAANGELRWIRHRLNDPLSLVSDALYCIYQDRSGRIWIGGEGGVATTDLSEWKFENFRYIPGERGSLSHPNVRAILEDSRGGVWVGTLGGGLNYRPPDGDRFQHFRYTPGRRQGLSSDRVVALMEDMQGNIWIGTENNGIDIYHPDTRKFSHLRSDPDNPNSLSSNAIVVLYQDRQGIIWIGTSGGGLNRYDPLTGQFRHYRMNLHDSTSLSGDWVWAIHEDPQGNLWVGTWGAGVCRLDPKTGRFKRYWHKPEDDRSLSKNSIFAIMTDRQGNLWLGTWGGGLERYDPRIDGFHHFTEKDGLPNNVIYGILEDEDGNLWLSTNRGLSRFNPRTRQFTNFGIDDGLQSNEFNQGAYCRGRDGRLYFGGIRGVTRFYPRQIRPHRYLPPLVITRFEVLAEPFPIQPYINSPRTLVLKYWENNFSFQMASLDYRAPQKNQYMYFLEGFDEHWTYSGTRRYVAYTNVPPGDYILRLKGSNSDGIWNPRGISVKIKILPPFWQTWWFILLSVLLVGGTIAAFVVYRFRQLLAIERLRARIAADLHDDIGAGLTEISILNEILYQKLPSEWQQTIGKEFRQIGERARLLIDKMSDIVWLVNPRRDTLFDLLSRLGDSAREILPAEQAIFRTENLESLKNVRLNMENRQHLFLIFKEAIHNALKHSEATEVVLSATFDGRKLRMTLRDNGKGFVLEEVRGGNGLQNMQDRARRLGGELHIHSRPGEGTVVEFHGRVR